MKTRLLGKEEFVSSVVELKKILSNVTPLDSKTGLPTPLYSISGVFNVLN
jgi:hypothetical protein